MKSTIFKPVKLGSLELKNRISMAPMTRARNADGIPNSDNALYYAQRSGAGLIITEGTAISDTAKGVLYIPGLYTNEQIEGWKKVTKAVHEKESTIFTQLWHVGRVSHTSNQPNGIAPVGPSDIQAATSFAWGYDENGKEGPVLSSKPRALSTLEVKQIVKDFVTAAKNAIDAGFDGVELHGANGYLIEQFLNPFVNNRSDEYGGSIENRARFLLEAIDAVIETVGAEKTAIRLTPYGGLGDLPHYDEIEATYQYLAQELTKRNLAYLHLMDQQSKGSHALPDGFLERFRTWYDGIIILAGSMNREKAEQLIKAGTIDIAGFGEPFISNPDLVERLENNWELTPPDRNLHYGLGNHGYTDWKTYQELQIA
ncbi:2,4-dienoyl-CoA reductase-like NADH-dependent reductase (Old Yellow Enzyme family) [Flavobacterium nitrogenifigens]|uniref:2,4-dienoyl-CoA reductase-like NADH-dependent reductase (Old Yellow Enzyme family) n=2 Tax=Flavobacterium TaxID=237 RepID=A0A7W7IW88_9FLAO|nr:MULTISPECIES: alkene reductase [Flavobacterium]MBB4801595.1 2,4-dienoyl-CoA reductase-like NADH-dependent reductase (Old Yellow Enzyme family) [Flavobacterium nitrogenifigens]MBB6386553.1 2,4-dienoyl-CoA reductase-like NADH-dependent reductase (Old Yellow Enzyme family) [Flavobacterium notoginsengisoli]